jgi:hypothetical protein
VSFPVVQPVEEVGGRAAQVLDPRNRWLASFGELAAAIRSAWSAETAWIDDWDSRNPARGQCGTSALVLQDACGGELVRGVVHETGRSSTPVVHYWNVLDDQHLDVTWQQFCAWAFVVRSERVERDQLLVNDWFVTRYRALRRRLDTV